jgi:hypothetical protein
MLFLYIILILLQAGVMARLIPLHLQGLFADASVVAANPTNQVRWLVPGVLQAGALNTVFGWGGMQKSAFCLYLVSKVSR